MPVSSAGTVSRDGVSTLKAASGLVNCVPSRLRGSAGREVVGEKMLDEVWEIICSPPEMSSFYENNFHILTFDQQL